MPDRKVHFYRGSSPHSRGGLTSGGSRPKSIGGSSPHSRGGLVQHRQCGLDVRLIPAFARRTTSARSNGSGSGAHPRIRGEDRSLPVIPGYPVGSSPHSRGGRKSAASVCWAPRLIPAFAGRTLVHQGLLQGSPRFGITCAITRRLNPGCDSFGSGLPCSTLVVAWPLTQEPLPCAADG